jgi:hypothetical protein
MTQGVEKVALLEKKIFKLIFKSRSIGIQFKASVCIGYTDNLCFGLSA